MSSESELAHMRTSERAQSTSMPSNHLSQENKIKGIKTFLFFSVFVYRMYSGCKTFWPMKCSSGRLQASQLYDSTIVQLTIHKQSILTKQFSLRIILVLLVATYLNFRQITATQITVLNIGFSILQYISINFGCFVETLHWNKRLSLIQTMFM